MKKIRCYLAVIALLATLSGSSLQGLASMAHAASSRQASAASAPFVAGKSTKSVAVRPDPPCPGSGTWDC